MQFIGYGAKRRALRLLCGSSIVVLTISFGASAPAKAQSAEDFAQMMASMKRLEARVAALETENKEAKKEAAAARAETQSLRQKLAAPTLSVPPAKGTIRTASIATSDAQIAAAAPNGLYAMAAKAPPIAPVPTWGGFYAGAAFGLGYLHANANDPSLSTFTTTDTGATFLDTETETDVGTEVLSGHGPGAMSSLFLGYNMMVDSKFLVGLQAEGALANTRANLSGTASGIETSTAVDTPPGGAAGTRTGVSTFFETGETDTLDHRWMVSLLARAGALVDPVDLLYLVGGYTYGRFEMDGVGFGLNGGTIGAGWERQIVPGWNLRAEYRYTKFQNKTLAFAGQGTFTTTSTSGGATSTEVENTSFADSTNLSGIDLHSFWIGVSHSFGQ